MTEEGEFKKRIQEELDRTVEVEGHKFNLDLFEEVVDEAKKEIYGVWKPCSICECPQCKVLIKWLGEPDV